jgi:hypothetical protein
MVSIFTKPLQIVPLLIAGQSICDAAPTESPSIGIAGRVYPRAGGLRSRRSELLEMLLTHLLVVAQKKTKRHACAASMSSPSRSLMRASP